MSDTWDSTSSGDGALKDSSTRDPDGSNGAAARSGLRSPTMADIDREVSEAMAAMDPHDLAELSGGASGREAASPGSELVGTIAGITADEVFLEFGAKAGGVLPRAQFPKDHPMEIGGRLAVVVDRYDEGSSLFFLRMKGASQKANWETLAIGSIVEGRVTGMVKGGLEVDLQGIRGFMPGSQVSTSPMKDISVLLSERVRCEVVEIDKRGKNVVLSRRRLLEKEEAVAREKLLAELEVGQIRSGIVRNITDFGAFVDLGGVEGLVHIRDLSWGNVDKVDDVLHTGDEVKVQVLKIDSKRDRISLGLKQALPDPWVNVPERYPVGTALKVRIVRLADFGAFAELEAGVDGLIPISEMGWSRTNRSSDAVSVGDMVDAVVIRLELDKRRLALSMKQAQPDPWGGVLEAFEPQSLVTGRITRLTGFGAFVELAPSVEGLIHISELSDGRVKTCADVVKEGQEVEARVLGIDIENRRISLSLRQAKTPTADAPVASPATAAEPPKQAKKRKKPLRGGLSSHYNW